MVFVYYVKRLKGRKDRCSVKRPVARANFPASAEPTPDQKTNLSMFLVRCLPLKKFTKSSYCGRLGLARAARIIVEAFTSVSPSMDPRTVTSCI